MPKVRIWALESRYDCRVVECLANKLVTHCGLNRVTIRSSGHSAVPRPRSSDNSSNFGLKRAVLDYLRDDDFIVFVIDTDGPITRHQRLQEPNSLINQINRVLDDSSVRGRVYLTEATHEIESWLLVDCLGIFCYFAATYKQYRSECRGKIEGKKPFLKVVNRHQKGDTELIVEQEMGGRGPKEYLEKYSEEILQCLNRQMPPKSVKAKRYSAKMSPRVAEHVVINDASLRRNNSLRKLGYRLGSLDKLSSR